MGNLFFIPMLPKNFTVEGDKTILHEFEAKWKTANLGYYPSSGFDLTDLQYLNSKRFEELEGDVPEIFIHSDLLHINKYASERKRWRDIMREFRIKSIKTYKFHGIAYKSIEIHKLKIHNSHTVKWLIFFRGYLNEEVLANLLRNKIQIPTVYTCCDGITHGMGGFEESIPTLFYPLIAKEFGIKHIITEQSIDGFFYGVFSRDIEYLRRWIKNTLRLTGSSALKSLLELDDTMFREALYQTLGSVPEYPVNTATKTRIFVYGEPIDMVRKTPKCDVMDKLTSYIEENSTVEQIFEVMGEENEEKDLRVNDYEGQNEDSFFSQDLALLEVVPVIGKIRFKIKNYYKTVSNLLQNPVELFPEVRDLRQIIVGNQKIEMYLMSQALLNKLKKDVPIVEFAQDLKIYIETVYGILVSDEDMRNWERLQFSDYSKLIVPKALKTMLAREQPSKLHVLCTDPYSFLRIKGMTESKLREFSEFQQTLLNSESINLLEKLPARDLKFLDYDYELTITENIERYRDLIVEHAATFHSKYVNNYSQKEIRNLEIFKTYYQHEIHLNFKKTGETYFLSGEMIRLLFTSESEKPYNIFTFYDSHPQHYLLDLVGNFSDEMKTKLHSELYNPEFGALLNANPQNYESLSKYMGMFGLELAQFQQDAEQPNYVLIEPSKYGITKFKEFNRELLQFMKTSPYSLAIEEITENLNTKVDVDESVLENILKYYPYQSAEHEDGRIKYNIQPNLLGSFMLKVEKLLFRNEESMSSAQILEELNKVQRTHCDTEYAKEQALIKSNTNVISLGNNTWIHSEYWHNDERAVPSVFIENLIIANDGKITYTEVLEAIRSNHYKIKESSIRAYILSSCRSSKDDLNVFVHKDHINKYPEINFNPVRNQLIGRAMLTAFKEASVFAPQFTKDELQEWVYNLLSEENQDERQIKLYFRNLCSQEYFLGHNGIYMVNTEKDIANIKYRKEPQYKTFIRSFIVQDLKVNPEGLPLKALVSKYKDNIPEGVSLTNFYKIFHNGHLFEKFRLNHIEYEASS